MISISVLDLTLLAWGIFAAGCILLAVLTVMRTAPQAIGQMWRLLASEGVFIALATLPFLIGGPAVPIALAVLAARACWEGADASGRIRQLPQRHHRSLHLAAAILGIAASACGWLLPAFASLAICAALACLWIGANMLLRGTHERTALPAALLDVALFPGILFLLLAFIARYPQAHPFIVLAFIHVEIFDSLAVLGGKLFGRTPFIKSLSPNKTWEGFFTGLLALVLLSLSYNFFADAAPPAVWALLVVAGGIGAVLGDVATSFHKRLAGIKDYPAVYGPQGGVLDMVDAWLVAVPLTAATAWLLGAFPG